MMRRPTPCLALVLVSLAGCRAGDGPPPNVVLPESYETGSEITETALAASTPPRQVEGADPRWWTTLGDPVLDALMQRALMDNRNLRVAFARIHQADAIAMQVRAARMPLLSGAASVSTGTSLTFFGDSRSTSVGLSLPVTYEVDLFGRYASEHQAARLEAEANELDMQSLAISVSSQVAEAWYDIVNARIIRDVLQEQLETNRNFYDLVLLRFEQGIANAVDVHQQRQQLALTESQLSLVEGQRSVLSYRLSVLVGAAPGAVIDPDRDSMPALPPPPPAGVPASLLEGRPDLQAFQRRVEAADERVGAAIASRLPSISLSFTPSWTWLDSHVTSSTGMQINARLDGFTWNAGGRLAVPLWDGMAGRGRVDAADARLDELVELYSQQVLTALLEVESAITLERQQVLNVQHLEAQERYALATLDATRDRYRAGLSDFLPVLTALRSYQVTQLALIDARRLLVSYRIQLHRALGGTWPSEIEVPASYRSSAEEEER